MISWGVKNRSRGDPELRNKKLPQESSNRECFQNQCSCRNRYSCFPSAGRIILFLSQTHLLSLHPQCVDFSLPSQPPWAWLSSQDLSATIPISNWQLSFVFLHFYSPQQDPDWLSSSLCWYSKSNQLGWLSPISCGQGETESSDKKNSSWDNKGFLWVNSLWGDCGQGRQ